MIEPSIINEIKNKNLDNSQPVLNFYYVSNYEEINLFEVNNFKNHFFKFIDLISKEGIHKEKSVFNIKIGNIKIKDNDDEPKFNYKKLYFGKDLSCFKENFNIEIDRSNGTLLIESNFEDNNLNNEFKIILKTFKRQFSNYYSLITNFIYDSFLTDFKYYLSTFRISNRLDELISQKSFVNNLFGTKILQYRYGINQSNEIAYKIIYLYFLLVPSLMFSQDCDELIQNIQTNGHFNIRYNENNSYQKFDTLTSLNYEKVDSFKIINDFKSNFPKILDGRCLNVNTKNNTILDFIFCDDSEREKFNSEIPHLFGKFEIISSIDEFYIFKYSGFEISGYFIFNSKDNYFYHFNGEPIISSNKKFIYSINNHTNSGLTVNVLEFEPYKELNYSLSYNIELISHTLLKYHSTNNLVLKLEFNNLIETRDKYLKVIETLKCKKTLFIN